MGKGVEEYVTLVFAYSRSKDLVWQCRERRRYGSMAKVTRDENEGLRVLGL